MQDALTLQRLALQTKIQLCEEEGWVPDVRAAVQELLTSLFASVYNHQDEEGRCYSDSLLELPEHDEVDGRKYIVGVDVLHIFVVVVVGFSFHW